MLILELLYLLTVMLLAMYGLNSLALTLLYRRRRGDKSSGVYKSLELCDLPQVTVQLPVYNERYVVRRLIEAAINLDWPAERLQLQILDDSTDETQQIIEAMLSHYLAEPGKPAIEHIRRSNRRDFKAGALQAGLASATGEFIAIFDADFIPPIDFLRNTIPLFKNEQIGCVQARWGHVNPASSRLTWSQALGIDGHFVVEQTARHTVGAFLNFNGTAGVWRRRCMNEAGGWQGDTLTEDLDLSYRAQLGGWQIVYQPEVVVPAELPVQIDAFKRQQFRWAKGSIQTALKLLGRLWQSPQPFWLKLLGSLHLTNYAVHPLMVLNLLLTLPMNFSHSLVLHLAPLFFTISAIGPPLLYWTAMRSERLPLLIRLERLILLIALGTGISLNNSRAVLEGGLNLRSDFMRTPKFAITGQSTQWQTSAYALPANPIVWLELLLALYALALLGWIINLGSWWLAPWLMLYGGGYGYVSGLAFVQAWQMRATQGWK